MGDSDDDNSKNEETKPGHDPTIAPKSNLVIPPSAASDAASSDSTDASPGDEPTMAPSGKKSSHSAGPDRSSDKPPALPIPILEGYEILDELGRGGMGVVYKARDTKLDRLVALKMIIGGKFASEDEIQRFRIEGEAAARLDHIGIVPIYEIGETQGNHFFSMKFVDGGVLADKLDDYQSNSQASVKLLVKIAQAVQHAHQRGVLHRDLKPANVLIDKNGDPAITDLGLAKRIDNDSGLTQTGLIMGTPGFMAPEQASGRKDITTAADVFSLGAILFWLISGKPPFTGETLVQTVMKTIECEVPSLRSLTPEADSDLDLICQKAMSKTPLDRYNSAAELAEDLQAWLDGEPISVRPPTALNMASVWVRKNLRTVLAACITGAICGLAVGGILVLGELESAAEQEFRVQQLGESSPTWVANFLGLRELNDWWQAIQMLIVPIVALCAFLCVLMVQPKTREANIIAAVTCGLFAGILTYLVGGSWGAMNSAAIGAGSRDIELLSTAMWLETDAERKLAQRALIQRYPGLNDMDQSRRQQRIREKIEHDQRLGLLPGMWMGVGIAVLFTTLPLTFTCILSGMLWQQGLRGWEWFGCTWERCAYCLVIFLAISFWLRDIKASPVIMLGSLAAVGFALFLAVKQVKWYWRVAMIPVPFICMALINQDISNMRFSGRNAGRATNDSQLRLTIEQSDRLLEQTDASFQRYFTGVAWLYLGEEEKYQKHCDQLLSTFENAYRPNIASRLAKICLLRADLQDPADLPFFYELSEFASAFESDNGIHWFYATRGLAEVRRGNPKKAIEWNSRARNMESNAEPISGYLIAFSYATDALAFLDLGYDDKARLALEEGQNVARKTRDNSMKDGHDNAWVDWLVFQVLEKEVQSRLNSQ